MGKKKKALLKYRRLGIISKKLEKKFANFLQTNLANLKEKIEKVQEPVAKPEVKKSEKPAETVKRKKTPTKKATTSAKKKTPTSTRKRTTRKTKTTTSAD